MRTALDAISDTGASSLALSISTSFRARSCIFGVGTVDERVLEESARGRELVAAGWSGTNTVTPAGSANITASWHWHAKFHILTCFLHRWKSAMFFTNVQRVRLITTLMWISATTSIANLPASAWVERAHVWTRLLLAVVRAFFLLSRN